MAKKKAVAGSWAKDKGLVGVVVYFTPEERRQLKIKASTSDVSLREFVRQSALAATPEEIQKKSG